MSVRFAIEMRFRLVISGRQGSFHKSWSADIFSMYNFASALFPLNGRGDPPPPPATA